MASLKRVALATYQGAHDIGADGPPLLAALAALDVTAQIVPWGSEVAWADFDAVLVRNTWDYVYRRDAFLAWAAEVSAVTRLANPLSVLTWNTDKRYLQDLAQAGVPTVPTLWVAPGEPVPQVPWDEVVVKPSVSAGGRLAARYRHAGDAAEHIRHIHATGATAMLQPYVASVDGPGESSVYVFGGRASHAIRRGPALRAGAAPADDMSTALAQHTEAAELDPGLARFAQRVLAATPAVLYARVDTAPGPDGQPLLLELEATEPFLFLELVPAGAARFARAVAGWLGGAESPRSPAG